MTPPAAPSAMMDSKSRVRRAGKMFTRISVTAHPTTAGRINIGTMARMAYNAKTSPPL